MNAIAILKLFLSLASQIATYINNKKLMEAGEAKAILEGLKEADSIIAKAKEARVNAHTVDINKDENNRANKRL